MKRKFMRLVIVNALSVFAGWFSLRYGWGIEPKNAATLAVYLAYIALMLPFLQSWIHRTEPGQ